MGSPTANKGLSLPTVGGESGSWGNDLNSNTISPIDTMLGGFTSITLASANYTFTATDIQNLGAKLSGALIANVTVFTSCIGFFFIENNCTGNFTVTLQATTAPTGGTAFGPSYVLPQGVRGWFVSDAVAGIRPAPSWMPSLLLAIAGSTLLTLRRTENDTTLRKAISIQSGSGSGNDYSINETGDGSNNVATVTEQIGSTVIGTKTSTLQSISLPLSLSSSATLAEISTPSAPAAGNMQVYAKAGDVLASQTPGGVERIIGVGLPGAQFLTINNNATTPNSQIDVTITGQVIYANSSGIALAFNNPGTKTCNLGTVGVNGIDTGTAGINNWVYIYGVSNGPNSGILASLTSPTSGGPSLANAAGYTYQVYLGAMQTDGSGNLRRTLQLGKRAVYTSGVQSITSTTTVTAATFFPPTAAVWKMFMANPGDNQASLTDSNGQTYGASAGTSVAREIDFNIDMFAAGTTFTYTRSAGSGAILMLGWEDRVNAT